VEVHYPVAETTLVEQLELDADIVGEGRVAASHDDGCEEQVAFVDQPRLDRHGGEFGATHADVASL
jgi:hypothetical protein